MKEKYWSSGSSTHERMFVILPEQLAASHLRECERHLNECEENRIGILYAAQFAYMALITIVTTVRYEESGKEILRSEGKEIYPRGPRTGAKIKDFQSLINGIKITKQDKVHLISLNNIRDALQHPIPGPTGYDIARLLRAIEVAVKIGMEMWDSPGIKLNADGPARVDAFAASSAILVLCSKNGLWNAC